MVRRPDFSIAHRLCMLSLLVAAVMFASCSHSSATRSAFTATATSPATATPTSLPAPTSTRIPCNTATQWKAPTDNIELDDLAMATPTDGWAVGSFTTGVGGPPSAGLVYHVTDGTWQRLPQTYPGAALVTISMGSADDGWAASTSAMTGAGDQVLVLHYSAGKWTAVDIPALDAVLKGPPGTYGGDIFTIKVQMFGPDAGWLFASTNLPRDSSNPESRSQVVILRYQHGTWMPIAAPPAAPTTEEIALAGVTADEAWLVETNYGTDFTTSFAHYVNRSWYLWPQTFSGIANQVTMFSPTDGWALEGEGSDSSLLHFDGASWTPIAGPTGIDPETAFTSTIFHTASNAAWFVALDDTGAMIEQFAKGHWQVVGRLSGEVVPQSLAAGAAGEVWGVGDIFHGEGCPPAFTGAIEQGVFLHLAQGTWRQDVLP